MLLIIFDRWVGESENTEFRKIFDMQFASYMTINTDWQYVSKDINLALN